MPRTIPTLLRVAVLMLLLTGSTQQLRAQLGEAAAQPQATLADAHSFTWFNTYGKLRLSDRFYWIAQTHFRFHQSETIAYLGQPAQLYNRHALAYRPNRRFQLSLGGVLRLNFNQDGVGEGELHSVPEWRIWHEYLFTLPTRKHKLYHRIRIEHRWTRGFFRDQPDWHYRNRFRYLMGGKLALSRRGLTPGGVYVAPEAEFILQNGARVIDSPLEDIRLTATAGYVVSPTLTVAAGFMYSIGQDLKDGSVWKQKHTARIHAYFSPDLRPRRVRRAVTQEDH